jgi:N-acetylglucosaminyldiphosphoundecaprenol N-acetyl-beta-D-mannosaminyltransferase
MSGSELAETGAASRDFISLFGMRISRTTIAESVATVLSWCEAPRGETCRFVVTPNTDHAVLFQQNPALQAAYADAALVLADGAPLVVAANLLGKRLPERVAGSDLVPNVLDAANKRAGGSTSSQAGSRMLRVFLLGAAPGIADQAAGQIKIKWPNLNIVGTYSPPVGFENEPRENERIISLMRSTNPDLLIVGFGAPRQELWVHKHQAQLAAKVVICAGATIDFLAGHKRRSPIWMRRVGLEWLHRVCSEPRRLAARYARDAWAFPQLLWSEWRRPSA